MTKRILVVFFFLFSVGKLSAQNLPLGSWRQHLPYSTAKFVVTTSSRIYCATDQGLFYVDKSDNSVQRYSKINGLSDVGIVRMDYSTTQKVLVLCYSNSNIDLIYDDKIVNVSDIQRRTATGDKSIFDISFYDRFAYVATGFGVLALDLVKAEIKETYIVGLTGNEVPVYAVTNDGNSIFATISQGVLQGFINDPTLNNFASWTLVIPNSSSSVRLNKIIYLNNHLAINFTSTSQDSVSLYNSTSYSFEKTIIAGNFTTRQLRTQNGLFYFVNNYSVEEWPADFSNRIRQVLATGNYANENMYEVSPDNATLFIADKNNGLVKYVNDATISFIVPNSPLSGNASNVFHNGVSLFAAHGVNRWNDSFDTDGYSTFDGTEWKTWNQKTISGSTVDLGQMMDVQTVISEPGKPDHVFAASRINGLFEFENNVPVKQYNKLNSSLQGAFGNPGQVKLGGLGYDSNGNLWVVNSGVNSPLNRLSSDGTWQAINLQAQIPNGVNLFFGDVLCDSYGQVWVSLISNGLIIYDPSSQKAARLAQETGGVHVNDIRAMVEDNEGQIWLGTSEGIAVIYSPGNATGGNPVQSQRILITINDITDYLLSKEIITAIVVDGANRKWVGTNGGGLYLLSPDGTKQIRNFNTSNSPLFSNNITSLAIHPKTGELFIGTDNGLISYISDATAGEEACNDVKVFPNPVKENYHGPIAIRGITRNGNVKITDVAGNIVYTTKANGGIAIWDGNNFNGMRAQTGVYLVFATDEKGDNTCVTKLLLVN